MSNCRSNNKNSYSYNNRYSYKNRYKNSNRSDPNPIPYVGKPHVGIRTPR
jgi:hypothetical protein